MEEQTQSIYEVIGAPTRIDEEFSAINPSEEICLALKIRKDQPVLARKRISYDKKKIDALASRDQLFSSQTPQTFKFDVIYKSHLSSYSKEATDDCSLVLSNGHDVHLVTGSKLNFKVTTKEDLKLLKALIK